MSKKQRIQELEEEIDFLTNEIKVILLDSGIWTARQRLAFWTNLNRVKMLKRELIELKNQ
ncbi:MAG: hypothetical protein AAF960_17400 [Bacteroidota bacterium]